MAGQDGVLDVLHRKAGAAVVLATVLLSPAALSASPQPDPSATGVDELAEIVVTGRVPGPPLWRVSRDDHVMWILPLVDAYPRDIEWDSSRVEALIGQSQEYIERPVANSSLSTLNPLTMARLMSAGKRYSRLPKDRKLADLLPADLYRRYEALKSRYFPRESRIEGLRVSVAGMELQRAIMDRENLETLMYRRLNSPQPITVMLRKWLKRNKAIRRTSPAHLSGHSLRFGEVGILGDAIEEASASEEFARWELDCFEKVLVYFEQDFSRVKRRANDWARGSADELLDPSPLHGLGDACNHPPLIPENSLAMAELRRKAPEMAGNLAPLLTGNREEGESISRQRWLAAAEAALARNKVTFSVLAVEDVVGERSLVSQLEEKGYEVRISAE